MTVSRTAAGAGDRHCRSPRRARIRAAMAITGRWPRAIFYDSKTTLFNWAGSWRGAASQLLKKHSAQVDEQAFVETWVRGFEGLHRRAAFFRYSR